MYSHQQWGRIPAPCPWQHLVLSCFGFWPSNQQHVVVSHYVLICNSLMTYDVEQLFMFIWHLYIFFGVWVFCPFLIGFFTALLLSFVNFFTYFGHRTSTYKCFTNIFSQPVAYIFTFLYKHNFRQTKSQEINLLALFLRKLPEDMLHPNERTQKEETWNSGNRSNTRNSQKEFLDWWKGKP